MISFTKTLILFTGSFFILFFIFLVKLIILFQYLNFLLTLMITINGVLKRDFKKRLNAEKYKAHTGSE